MKRWTFRIVLCLLLGVVTTVAVAWIPSSLVTEFAARDAPTDIEEFVAAWEQAAPGDWAEFQLTLACERVTVFFTEDVLIGRQPKSPLVFCAKRQFGLPRRSAERKYSWAAVGSTPAGNIVLKAPPTGLRAIPYQVLFPGFLINTLFYAVIWFGLFFGIGWARRVLRRKRGCCVKCGYDLRGTPDDVGGPGNPGGGCPECGWNRKP